MAEVIGIIGLISSIITIAEAAYGIYESAGDAHGLPKKLQATAEQIPLLVRILQLADQNIQSRQVDQQTLQSAQPILQRCEERITEVKTIFARTIPASDASRAERMKKAVGLRTKSNKVKELMEEVMQDTELLAKDRLFSDALVLQDIQSAIEQLGNLPEEEDRLQFTHSGTGSINANTGAGTQHNYSNSGSGSQYNANTQNFGRDTVQNQYNIENYHAAKDNVTKSDEELDHDILASLAFPQMLERRNNIERPYQGTGQWIFEHQAYRDWCGRSSGLLWIKGNPGVGKSTIMSQLYDSLSSQRDSEHGFYLDFFFSARGAELQYTPVGMYRSLLNQIFDQNTAIRGPVRQVYQDKINRYGQGQLQVRQNWQWQQPELEKLLTCALTESADCKPVMLFIDALDESGKAARDLARYFHHTNDRAHELSLPIKICISCRHHPVPSTLPATEIAVEGYNGNDMQLFVQDRLRYHAPSANDDDEYRRQWHLLVQDLVERADGVFLWASLMIPRIDEYLDGGEQLEVVRDMLCQVPEGLEDVYDDILRRKIKAEHRVQSSWLFRWTLFAREPLSVVGTYTAVTAACRGTSRTSQLAATSEHMKAQIRAWSGGLVRVVEPETSNDPKTEADSETEDDSDTESISQASVQVIHQSVIDFLHVKGLATMTDLQNNIVSPVTPSSTAIDLERCHATLYWACLHYLNRYGAQQADLASSSRLFEEAVSTGYREIYTRDPFLKYVSSSTLHHGRKAGSHRTQDLREEVRLLDLLASLPDASSRSGHRRHFRCALGIAAFQNWVDLVHYLLVGDGKIGTSSHSGCDALVSAVSGEHPSMVKLLLEHDFDVDARDHRGDSALHIAALALDKGLSSLLLQHGADVNAKNNEGDSVLHWAMGNRTADDIQLQLQHGANIDTKDNMSNSVLPWALYKSRVDIVQLLLQHGAVIDAKNNRGVSVLQRAVHNTTVDVTHVLLQHGADVNAVDNAGESALHSALWQDGVDEGVVRTLLQHGADVNAKNNVGDSVLHYAVYRTRMNAIQLLLQHGADANAVDNAGESVLYLTLRQDEVDEDVVRTLLQNGADVNALDDRCRSALHWAVLGSASPDVIQLLLQDGAEINAQDIWGFSALQIALRRKEVDKDIVQVLLQHGASPATQTESERCSQLRPVDCAQ